MRIVLTTCGSRGDVQPMMALTLALMKKGHDCLLAGPPEKSGWAKSIGCPYMPFGRDVTALIDSMDSVLSVRSMVAFIKFVREETVFQLKALAPLFKDADVAVASSLMFGASTVAEKLKRPYRYVAFTPQLFASGEHPFPVVQHQGLPRTLNRAYWIAARLFDRFNITRVLNRYRKTDNLPLLSDAWDHILGDRPILACDKAVAKVPRDVTKKVIQTGYLHLEIPLELNRQVLNFIEKGRPVVYAGFGSMPPLDQKQKVTDLIKAAKATGCRMIIAAFWQQEDLLEIDPDVLFVRQAPHRLLFPLMDLIIHHGGAGTTATAAAAGKPQIIVPLILDQCYHGQKLFESGIAARPILLKHMNSGTLETAMADLLGSRPIKLKAEQVGQSIDTQKSLKSAVRAVEACELGK